MKIVTGDLLDPLYHFPAIGHGVNLRGVMGAGVAKQIAKWSPTTFKEYKKACDEKTLTLGTSQMIPLTRTLTVFNLATQVDPGPCAKRWAVFTAVDAAMSMCEGEGIDVLALPQIGCGLGGLSWGDVKHDLEVVERAHQSCSLTIVIYDKNSGKGREDDLSFEVTDEHIKLLRHLNIDWDDSMEYGGPVVDPKRPFGNGDVARDIYKILEWEAPEGEESVDDLFQHDPRSRAIYEQMEHVLQLSCRHPGEDIRGRWTREQTYYPFTRTMRA